MRHREERSDVAIQRRLLDCFAALAMTLLLLVAAPAAAQTFPKLTGRVVDAANLLDDAAERSLTERLAKLETETTDQMVVVTVPSLDGQTIEKYSLDLANRWKIGRADVDNGVMLLVAPNERKVRIEVGHGLEGLLTDDRAATIIQSMLPHFKNGAYDVGIVAGVAEVDRLLSSDRRRPMRKPATMKKAA